MPYSTLLLYIYPLADPEVLGRGGELRGHKGIETEVGAEPISRKFVNLKVKMADFRALLSIDFKV